MNYDLQDADIFNVIIPSVEESSFCGNKKFSLKKTIEDEDLLSQASNLLLLLSHCFPQM